MAGFSLSTRTASCRRSDLASTRSSRRGRDVVAWSSKTTPAEMLCTTASKRPASSTSPNSSSESSLVYDPNGILTCDMLRSLGPGLLSGRRSELFSFRMQDYADADVVVLISEIIFRLALKPSSHSLYHCIHCCIHRCIL